MEQVVNPVTGAIVTGVQRREQNSWLISRKA